MITFKRTISGRVFIYRDGDQIGEIWKFKKSDGFGMSLQGIYFRNRIPNKTGGSTATGEYKRQMDAKADVENILKQVGDPC